MKQTYIINGWVVFVILYAITVLINGSFDIYNLGALGSFLTFFVLYNIAFYIVYFLFIHKKKPGCYHNNWGPVNGDYQYCQDCGIAQPVPTVPCEHHIDEIISKIEIPNKTQTTKEVVTDTNTVSGIIYVNRCEKCGRIEKVEIKL